MHVDLTTLNRLLPYVVSNRNPIMIRGPHGIGKSEIVYQLAPQLAKILKLKNPKYVYPVVERRASQMADAGDLMGLPQLDGVTTSFLPMKWFHQACTEPSILFLDELDRACSDVRQAVFELGDSRKIAGHSLHPDTIVIACCNGGPGENRYQVGDMDPAEISRWTVFDFRPTVNEWLTHAKGKVADQVYDFIHQNGSFLEHGHGEFEPNKVYPCRRSWFRLSSALKDSEILEEAKNDLILLCSAYVGQEASTSFHEFCATYNRQVTVEDIVNKGQWEKTVYPKKWEVNQHMTMISKMKDAPLMKEKFNTKQIENICRYFFCIPSEVAMELWQTLTVANHDNGVAMFDVVIDDRSVSDYIGEINGIGLAEKDKK